MKKIFIVFAMSLVCLMISGCSEASREKKEITQNAMKYLTEKYDIKKSKYKIEVNGFYGQHERCYWSCGENRMKIKYNNKIYNVYYNNESNVFSDNIQYATILEDIKKEFNNKYATPLDIEIKAKEDNSEYYNGTNLKSVINELSINAIFVNKQDYNENETNKILKDFYNEYGGIIRLIFFKNDSDYKKYADYKSEYQTLNNTLYGYEHRYIDFWVGINNGNIEKNISNKIKLEDGFIAAGWNLPDGIKMNKIQPFDLNEISDYNSSLYTTNSNFYKLSSDQNDISTISFRILRENDAITENNLVAMKKIDRNGNISYELTNATQKGRLYITKYTNYKEIDFVIMKKNDE